MNSLTVDPAVVEIATSVDYCGGYFAIGLIITGIYLIMLMWGLIDKAVRYSKIFIENGSGYSVDSRSEILTRVISFGFSDKDEIYGENGAMIGIVSAFCSLFIIVLWPIFLVVMLWVTCVGYLRMKYVKKNE